MQTLAEMNTDFQLPSPASLVVVLLSIQAELHRVAAHCVTLCSKGASEVNAAAMQREREREGERGRAGVRKQSGAEIWAEKKSV